MYGLLQLLTWTMFYALGVYWIIAFPVHYRSSSTKMIKSIHVVTVTVALVFPAVPIMFQIATGGYRPYYSSTRFCSGKNFSVTYWTFLLPAVVILSVTIFALMVVSWIILKVITFNVRQCMMVHVSVIIIDLHALKRSTVEQCDCAW